MKLKQLFLIGLTLAWISAAHATDALRVANVGIAPGESATLSIEMNNETTNLMGWQCDIVLPENLSLALKANGKPAATLGDRFMATVHSISSSRLANGAYRFIATSLDGEAIPGNSGILFTVTLQADASSMPGVTTGKLTNIEFNTQDNRKLTLADMAFTITISAKDMPKCATPTIAYERGELVFSSETEGAAFVSDVKVADAKGSEGARLKLTSTYEITVYAKCDGYADSDVVSATIGWRNGRPAMMGFSSVKLESNEDATDVNGDGAVDVADIATVISDMAARARKR